MKKENVKLTKRVVDAAQCPEAGQEFLRDDTIPGFAVRLTPGKKSFVLEKRIKGRMARLTLGQFGIMTADQAREAAIDLINRINKGEDPREDKEKQKREEEAKKKKEVPFRELAERYLELYAKPHKKSWKNDFYMIESELLPAWGNRLCSSIEHSDVALLHAKIGKDRPIQANRIMQVVKKMFALAISYRFVDKDHENPVKGLVKYREEPRERVVTDGEAPRLLEVVANEPNIYIWAAILLYLTTACRKSEILSAKWPDIDFNTRELTLTKTKNQKRFIVILSEAAMWVLSNIPREEGNPHIFPGRFKGTHLKGIRRAWDRIRKEAGVEDVRIHDLRRTVGSWMASRGESLHLIGKVLNHSSNNQKTTAIYARLADKTVRAALEKQGAVVMALLEKKENPVDRMAESLFPSRSLQLA